MLNMTGKWRFGSDGVQSVPCNCGSPTHSDSCEGEGDVVAVVAPLGRVAQVVSHGVNVVGVHEEEGKEKDEEVRMEVQGEIEELREKRSSWMVWRWSDGHKDDLSQCGVTRDQDEDEH